MWTHCSRCMDRYDHTLSESGWVCEHCHEVNNNVRTNQNLPHLQKKETAQPILQRFEEQPGGLPLRLH